MKIVFYGGPGNQSGVKAIIADGTKSLTVSIIDDEINFGWNHLSVPNVKYGYYTAVYTNAGPLLEEDVQVFAWEGMTMTDVVDLWHVRTYWNGLLESKPLSKSAIYQKPQHIPGETCVF